MPIRSYWISGFITFIRLSSHINHTPTTLFSGYFLLVSFHSGSSGSNFGFFCG
jgi:hypothetical protein